MVATAVGVGIATAGTSSVGSAILTIGGTGLFVSGIAEIGAGISGNELLGSAATKVANITNPAGLVTTTITYAMTGDEGTADTYGSVASLVFDGAQAVGSVTQGIINSNLADAGTAALSVINDLVQMGTDSVSPPQGPTQMPGVLTIGGGGASSGVGGSGAGTFDISSFESAGFGGCGPAYCPNQ
jgi:hypothetical protein